MRRLALILPTLFAYWSALGGGLPRQGYCQVLLCAYGFIYVD